jgi:hypothetical protein
MIADDPELLEHVIRFQVSGRRLLPWSGASASDHWGGRPE